MNNPAPKSLPPRPASAPQKPVVSPPKLASPPPPPPSAEPNNVSHLLPLPKPEVQAEAIPPPASPGKEANLQPVALIAAGVAVVAVVLLVVVFGNKPSETTQDKNGLVQKTQVAPEKPEVTLPAIVITTLPNNNEASLPAVTEKLTAEPASPPVVRALPQNLTSDIGRIFTPNDPFIESHPGDDSFIVKVDSYRNNPPTYRVNIHKIKPTTWFAYPNVNLGEPAKNLTLSYLKTKADKDVFIEVRKGKPDGTLIAEYVIKNDSLVGRDVETVTVPLKEPLIGVHDIYFVFHVASRTAEREDYTLCRFFDFSFNY